MDYKVCNGLVLVKRGYVFKNLFIETHKNTISLYKTKKKGNKCFKFFLMSGFSP